MKPKREPKKGDRCEHAARESDSIRLHRDCNVRHLEGNPPGMLVPRVVDGKTALLCTGHCRLYEAPNVRKQKPRKVDAEQVDLVEAAGLVNAREAIREIGSWEVINVYPNPDARSTEELFPRFPMPEGI